MGTSFRPTVGSARTPSTLKGVLYSSRPLSACFQGDCLLPARQHGQLCGCRPYARANQLRYQLRDGQASALLRYGKPAANYLAFVRSQRFG